MGDFRFYHTIVKHSERGTNNLRFGRGSPISVYSTWSCILCLFSIENLPDIYDQKSTWSLKIAITRNNNFVPFIEDTFKQTATTHLQFPIKCDLYLKQRIFQMYLHCYWLDVVWCIYQQLMNLCHFTFLNSGNLNMYWKYSKILKVLFY